MLGAVPNTDSSFTYIFSASQDNAVGTAATVGITDG
jgi:hypothetical protein